VHARDDIQGREHRPMKELGAEAVVDYVANPDWPVVVRSLQQGAGPDRIVDVGGPGTLAKSINAVAHGGQSRSLALSLARPLLRLFGACSRDRRRYDASASARARISRRSSAWSTPIRCIR